MAAEELHEALDRGFATRATVRDAAMDADEPEDLLAYARQVVDEDPDGAACAIFAMVVEDRSSDADGTANLAWLFEEWKRSKRDEMKRRQDEGERRRDEAERRRGEEGD